MKITVFGARGSTPSSCPENARYGGDTSCVVVELPNQPPIILDLGSGVRRYGAQVLAASTEPFVGTALLTHLHWDHIQGLPFFGPALQPGAKLEIFSIVPECGSLRDAVCGIVSPPVFPVTLEDFAGEIRFTDLCADNAVEQFHIGEATVTAAPVPHLGPTCGFRIDWRGRSIAYVPDHQEPPTGQPAAPAVIDLCRNVDLLFHDAQYTREQFPAKATWGHSTDDFAVALAAVAGVDTLALFHHDPGHADSVIDELVRRRQVPSDAVGQGCALPTVIAASEGLQLFLEPRN